MADPVRRWGGLAEQAEERFGVPANVLLGLIKVESGGQEGRTSSAGAQGLTQFMPGTARSIGVDVRPGHARSQVFGAAKYLKELGFQKNPQLALSSYNAGPGNPGAAGPYASNVLSAAKGYRGVSGGGGGGGGGADGGSSGGSTDSSAGSQTAGAPPDLGAAQSMLPLLQALQDQNQQPRSSAGVQAPAFSAAAPMPGGYQPVVSGGGGPAPKPDIGPLLSAVQTLGGNVPGAQGAQGAQGSASGQVSPTPGGKTSALGGDLAAAATTRANVLDEQRLPYKWGGGHGARVAVKPGAKVTPLDCSGAVSAVLGIDPRVSGQFRAWGRAGDGGNKGVTVYANDEHVLMKINGHFFGTSRTNPGGGAGWIPQGAISKEYLSRFTARHSAR